MESIKNTMNTQNPNQRISNRLYSLDALRGFDMFWIVGGSALIMSLGKHTEIEWFKILAEQFRHVPWDGFHFIDLIFPLFMFISGAVIPFSVLSKTEKGEPKKHLIWKAAKRTAILIILGIIYNGTLKTGFSDARYVSVLGQIGFAYFFAVLIVLYTDPLQKKIIWLIGILASIAILQLFVPVPGVGAGILTPEGCINGYIDRLLLPGRLAFDHNGWTASGQGIYDALGILSTISSIGITLMGFFSGYILRSMKQTGLKKTALLAGIGTCLIILALLIDPVYPIIKNCWTTTFSLLTGGISFISVAFFYLIIDVWGLKKWSFCFRVIGMNPLFIYLFYRMVKIRETSEFLLGWLSADNTNPGTQPVVALGVIILVYGILYFLYKNKIFIKI
jgi:predicted acyltransferase